MRLEGTMANKRVTLDESKPKTLFMLDDYPKDVGLADAFKNVSSLLA